MIKAKLFHCGQCEPYGGFLRIWNVQTDLPQDEVVKWCFEKLYHGKVLPLYAEWKANIAYGAPHFSDPGYYFAGYYAIREIDDGFEFKVCKPFCD